MKHPVLSALLVFLCMVGCTAAFGQQDKRPNIVIIMADDLGCYGGEIQTPWTGMHNLAKDHSELYDLAGQYPGKVKELPQLWQQMAHETKALPNP